METIKTLPTFKEKGIKLHLLIGEWKFLDGTREYCCCLLWKIQSASDTSFPLPWVPFFPLFSVKPCSSLKALLRHCLPLLCHWCASCICLLFPLTVIVPELSCSYLVVSNLPSKVWIQEAVPQPPVIGSQSVTTNLSSWRCRWPGLGGSQQPFTPSTGCHSSSTRSSAPRVSPAGPWSRSLLYSFATQSVVPRPAPRSSSERQTIRPYLRPTKSSF